MPIEAYVSASLTKPCSVPVAVTPLTTNNADGTTTSSENAPLPPNTRYVDDGMGGKILVRDELTTSEQRLAAILKFLQESPYWKVICNTHTSAHTRSPYL
jgi:hypothetical protein